MQATNSNSKVEQQADVAASVHASGTPVDQKARRLASSPERSVPLAHVTIPFRPINRQPLAKLTILNDGSNEGEEVFVRKSQLVIGRAEGDVTLPFDSDMSKRHAELRCVNQNGKYRWYLYDLSSTNGTFLRGFKGSLYRETELILGSHRYLFQLPPKSKHTDALRTHLYMSPTEKQSGQSFSQLVETGTGVEDAIRFSILGTEALFGSGLDCDMKVADPFLSPVHARFYQDKLGRWVVEDQKSLNGVWLRIRKTALDTTAEFQLGEQRFRFEPEV